MIASDMSRVMWNKAAQRMADEIYRQSMQEIGICCVCRKVLMYWVTIKGRQYCEQCAHKGWEEVK